jgi:BirA family biotin operon repressor/biotin-[acetyl-CoA-carboxylase] ligase
MRQISSKKTLKSPAKIATDMNGARFGWPRLHLDTVESTMPVLADLARSGARHGTVVTTDFQIAGTGREGRPWIAPPGSSLLMSVLFRTHRPAQEVPVVSLLIAGCVASTLDKFGIDSTIKWPNDVLVEGRKISGILLRSSPSPRGGIDLVAGIGLNVRREAVTGIPAGTSLEREAGMQIPHGVILDALLSHLGEMATDFEAGPIEERLATIANRLAWSGEPVEVAVGSNLVRGTLEGVRSDGALRIVGSDGARQYVISGELQRGPKPVESAGQGDWYTLGRQFPVE